MVNRGRAWRRYKKERKTIRNVKERYYRWTMEPRESVEGDADLSWYQCITGNTWKLSQEKTEKIGYRRSMDGGSPFKKYYRAKVKEFYRDEVKEFYREVYQ